MSNKIFAMKNWSHNHTGCAGSFICLLVTIMLSMAVLQLEVVNAKSNEQLIASSVNVDNRIALWTLDLDAEHNNRARKLSSKNYRKPYLSSLSERHVFTFTTTIAKQLQKGKVVSFEIPARSMRKGTAKDRLTVPKAHTKSCVLQSGNILAPPALLAKSPAVRLFTCHPDVGEELVLMMNVDFDDGMRGTYFDKLGRTMYIDSIEEGADSYMIYDSALARRERTYSPEILELLKARVNATKTHHHEKSSDEVEVEVELGSKEIIDFPATSLSSSSPSSLRASIEGQPMRSKQESSQAQRSPVDIYVFKLAVITTTDIGDLYQNNVDLILVAILNIFSRINGIFSKELGIYFQLVEDVQKVFCVKTPADAECDEFTARGLLARQHATAFLEERGIPLDSYDIGHTIAFSGAIASFPSLCRPNPTKAGGLTGFVDPEDDFFILTLLAHELAHQLEGGHSFRDCFGPGAAGEGTTFGYQSQYGVEPGSGSTILSYAGTCSNRNIVTRVDPYFNNLNQQQMRDFITGEAQSFTDQPCGEKIVVQRTIPSVQTPTTCKIPLGNYFQLTGGSSSALSAEIDEVDENFFSWDRVDVGQELFLDTETGRFRSFKPTKSVSRFFPNLYILNFEPEQEAELLPSIEKTMDFRFTQRRFYESGATLNDIDVGLIGDFVYSDTQIEFLSETKLQLLSPGTNAVLPNEDNFEVIWNPDVFDALRGSTVNANTKVEVLFATHSMSAVNYNRFDYEIDNEILNWKVLEEVDASQGFACINLFEFIREEEGNVEDLVGNLMIRVSGVENQPTSDEEEIIGGCYFFDLITNINISTNQSLVSTSTCVRAILPPGSNPGDDVTPLSIGEGAGAWWVVLILVAMISMLVVYVVHRKRQREKQVPEGDANSQGPRPMRAPLSARASYSRRRGLTDVTFSGTKKRSSWFRGQSSGNRLGENEDAIQNGEEGKEHMPGQNWHLDAKVSELRRSVSRSGKLIASKASSAVKSLKSLKNPNSGLEQDRGGWEARDVDEASQSDERNADASVTPKEAGRQIFKDQISSKASIIRKSVLGSSKTFVSRAQSSTALETVRNGAVNLYSRASLAASVRSSRILGAIAMPKSFPNEEELPPQEVNHQPPATVSNLSRSQGRGSRNRRQGSPSFSGGIIENTKNEFFKESL